MTWPDCSPPSDEAALEHLLHHVLVADRAAHQLDARLAQRDLEADVAHHGRDDGVAAAAAPAPSCGAPHSSITASPSTTRAAVVDEDRAIAVAVERHAHPVAALAHERRPGAPGCVEPHSRLMLRPSGSSPMTVTSKPSSRNSRGATVVVAPLAVSIARRKRPSRSGSGSAGACARCRRRRRRCDRPAAGRRPAPASSRRR